MRVLALLVLLTIFSTASASCDGVTCFNGGQCVAASMQLQIPITHCVNCNEGYSGLLCQIENASPKDVMTVNHDAYDNYNAGAFKSVADCKNAAGTIPPAAMYHCLYDNMGPFQRQFMANTVEYIHAVCGANNPAVLPAALMYLKKVGDSLVCSTLAYAPMCTYIMCKNGPNPQTCTPPVPPTDTDIASLYYKVVNFNVNPVPHECPKEIDDIMQLQAAKAAERRRI